MNIEDVIVVTWEDPRKEVKVKYPWLYGHDYFN